MSTPSEVTLASLDAKLTNMSIALTANMTSQLDDLLVKVKDLLAASKASKEKKKDATASDTKEAASSEEAKKSTHPTYTELAASCWIAKKSGKTQHDKIERFVVGMFINYPSAIRATIGEDNVVGAMAECKEAYDKVNTPNQKASTLVASLWKYLEKHSKLAQVETALTAFWEKERSFLIEKQLGQVTAEPASAAELAEPKAT